MKAIPLLAGIALLLLRAPSACAQAEPPTMQETPTTTGAPRLLDTVVVTGAKPAPGPGMWHVYSQDRDLWILGTLSPLPAHMKWNSSLFSDLLAQAQEVVWEPYFTVNVKAGFFQKLLLGYGMLRASRNPDGDSLRDVLSPELYARWASAKTRYLPDDHSMEFERPVVAANKLFAAAVAAQGLSSKRIWLEPINAAVKAHGLKPIAPAVIVDLDVSTAKSILQKARKASFNDAECMEATLDAIEQYLPRIITNANAWATGDLTRLDFSQVARRDQTCADVFENLDFAREKGVPDISRSIKDRWMQEVEAALKRNRSTIAIAPLENILGPNGYAARLQAEGYEVESP